MSAIRKGDLVIVVRCPHACNMQFLGTIHEVLCIRHDVDWRCNACPWFWGKGTVVEVAEDTILPIEYVKKIEGDEVEQMTEEICL